MHARRFVSIVMFACLLAPLACKRESAPAPQTKPASPPAAAPASPPPAAAPAPFRVSSVTVGNAIGADKKVVAPSATFAPSDTIYASVATEGASPSAELSARWTYEDGQLVNQESQAIAPTGPANSEFHISKPDGFPAGKYKVEIALNGAPVGTKEFEVRATP
jgi:hypothetical protein